MAIRTFSSREFLRDAAAVKRAAQEGPVFITDRGEPRFVLLTVQSYYAQQNQSQQSFLAHMDAIDGGGSFEFEPATLDGSLRIPDFS